MVGITVDLLLVFMVLLGFLSSVSCFLFQTAARDGLCYSSGLVPICNLHLTVHIRVVSFQLLSSLGAVSVGFG